ncbi:hypothetical protein CBR_g30677 [Chara braunii]|uniref:Integrase catalytic domain-containing protein n=1 Tax=Chara braunii TaxID=69332 RepID=A0A388LDC6_CHABU|nr:hypothetical protein CBR_g30677 [Chara braunii]|eukprot:GBG80309.1 hypothetical protein CBR_g30677 [Chara braunii]
MPRPSASSIRRSPIFLSSSLLDRPPASRRHRSSTHFDAMETGYDFILGTPWSRQFRSTEVNWVTNTLVLKTKCGQTYPVPFIGTTATPRPDPPPLEPSVRTLSPTVTVTSPRQFAHFIRQDDVTFFMVNVTNLLHYDPPCPDAELIPLEPDPPSISMAPISTSHPPPSVESTPPSRADADAKELARYTTDLEPAVPNLIREYHDVFPSSFSYADIPPMRDARWWRNLSEFSFTTKHIMGETNRVADPLSRRPDHDQEQIHLASISVTSVHHSVIDEFRTQYRHCPDYRDIYAILRSGKTVPNYSLGDHCFVYWHGSQGTREPRICVPSTGQLRVRAVAEFHDEASADHMGFHKMLAHLSRLYVWPKRKNFVKDYVAKCPTCQEVNNANHLPYDFLQPLPIPEGRWQSISMDFIGPLHPLTPRGHDAILVVVDHFTKRAHFVLCQYAISAHEVADIVFDQVVRDHGLPLSIISDHDPCFTSRFWRRLHEVYGTQLRFSSSYHPQTKKRLTKTLGDILRKIVRDDQQWDLHLAHAEIAYNHAVSPTTGMSPYYCDLDYHPRVPVNFLRPSQMHPETNCPALDDWVAHMTSIMKTAHEHIAASQTRMAARANRSRMDHSFKVGDDLLIDARHLQLKADTLRKFQHRFFGPCRILQVVGFDTAYSPFSFRVKLPDYLRQTRVHDVYHVSLLRPYRRPSRRFAGRPYERPPPIMVDGHEEFLVSDIVGYRVTDDNPPHVEYLVRWKGYADEEATWEPLEHLQHARMLVRAYDRARRVGLTAPPQPTDPPLSPSAEETAEVELAPSEADLQQQSDASERPQRTRRRPARYDD